MAIVHLGAKRLQGTKLDRVVDSLGSSADGSNNGITLLTGKEITWTSSGSTVTQTSITKSTASAGWTNNYAHSQSYSSGIVIVEFDPNVGQGYGSLCGFDDGTNNSTPTDITLGMAGLTSATNCNSIVSGTATDQGSGSWAAGDTMKIEYNIDSGAYVFSRNGTSFVTGTLTGGAKPSSVRVLVSNYSQNYKVTEIKLSGGGTSATANQYKLGTGAYAFNGSTSKVETGDKFSFLQQTGTIAFWMKPTSFADNDVLFDSCNASSSNSGVLCKVASGSNLLSFLIARSGGNSSQLNYQLPSDPSGEWTHITITYDGSTAKFYNNGTEAVSGSVTSTTNASTYNLFFGETATGDDNPYDGVFDDIGIWDRVLTATEISTLCGTTGSLDSDDFDNVYGSTQYARGFKVATSSSALKDKKVKAVTFYVRKAGSSPTGTAYAKIYNGTTLVETNTTGTNLDVSTLGTSDYTAHKFEFTGNTTLDTGYSVVYYFDGGSGSAYTQIRRQGSDVYDGVNTIYRKYHSSAWADDSGTDAKFILEFADPQLVSSLTNKSGLKAHYTMDSTSLGATKTYEPELDNNSASKWVIQDSGAINLNTSNSRVDFSTKRDNSNNTLSYDLGSNLNATWVLRYKFNASTFSESENSWLSVGFRSVDSATAVTGSSTNFDTFGCFVMNGSSASNKKRLGMHSGTANTSLTEHQDRLEGVTYTTSKDYYVEVVRTGTTTGTVTLREDSHTGTVFKTYSYSGGNNATNLRYLTISDLADNVSGDSTLVGTITDIEVYDGVSELEGCKNDFSSTSNLDGMTNLPTNTIFLQTDDTPSYWWKQSDNTWKLDGTSTWDSNFAQFSTEEEGQAKWITSDSTRLQYGGVSGSSSDDKKYIDWDLRNDNSNDTIYYNLGKTVNSSKWVLRYKINFSDLASNTSTQGILGLSSITGSADSTQDFLGISFLTGDDQIRGISTDSNPNGIPSTYNDSIDWQEDTDYYIQIERTSATAFKAYVRTGSYSGTILASITNGVTTSAIGGLQYIKIQNRVTNNSPSPRLTIKEVGLLDGFSEWA